MKLKNIIREGIVYPTTNFKRLIILGIILVIMALPTYIGAISRDQNTIYAALIISIIVIILVEGYKVSIIKQGTERNETIPQIKPKNFITGIKSIIVSILYYIIPIIISTLYVRFLSGLPEKVMTFVNMIQQAAASQTHQISITAAQYFDLWNTALITLLVVAILLAIFSIVANVAQARLADTNSLKSALNAKKVIEKLLKIGIDKYILYVIITLIIYLFLIGFMVLMTIAIPYLGIVIDAILIYPILYLFQNYTIGLIYRTN